MIEPNTPGPGRSTAESAISQLKKEVARRNEEAQKVGRQRRAAREKDRMAHLRSAIESDPRPTGQ